MKQLGTMTCAVLLAMASETAADAMNMCLEMQGATEATCTCASEKLTAEVGAKDAKLYDAVGTRYLANKEAGQGMGDAWDVAVAETAAEAGLGRTALLSRMNAIGKAHRAAIKGCT